MYGKKVLKILEFWFADTWNNIGQCQQNGSYIQMSDVSIWVGRIQARILPELHKSIHTHRYVCMCMGKVTIHIGVTKLSYTHLFAPHKNIF